MPMISKLSLNPEHRRVILLIDVDAFEIQVYQNNMYPETIWKPCVATNKSGRIVAVSYEAKALGVSRKDGHYYKAKAKCPSLVRLHIPENEDGTPDYALKRTATELIIAAIRKYCNELYFQNGFQKTYLTPIFELASPDEFFLDATELVDEIIKLNGTKFPSYLQQEFKEKTIVEDEYGNCPANEWYCKDLVGIRLFYGLSIATKLFSRILYKTGFKVSVGVGTNKLVAKMACELNKPEGITMILPEAIEQVGDRIKIDDIPGLKSKAGESIIKNLCIKYMNDLAIPEMTVEQIAKAADGISIKRAQDIWNSVRGICNKEVSLKVASKSAQSSHTFGNARSKGEAVTLSQLMNHIVFRIKALLAKANEELEWRNRIPMKLKLTIKRYNEESVSAMLPYPVDNQDPEDILEMFMDEMGFDKWWRPNVDRLTDIQIKGEPFIQVPLEEV